LDRFVSLLGALAWPVATLVIALIFRSDVTRALGRVGWFKYRDLELSFRDNLHNAEEVARSIPAAPASKPTILELDAGVPPMLTGGFLGDLSQRAIPSTDVAARTPRDVVESAWGEVCNTLVQAATGLGDQRVSGLEDPDVASRFLIERGALPKPEAMLVGLLRNLRERARLDPRPLSADDARRYVDLARKVAARIEVRA
jgi:hypothetical protein